MKTEEEYPRCTECKMPFIFERLEPFAYCECGTTEWGNPRPKYIVYSDEVIHNVVKRLYENIWWENE